jgi:hypothetical protein
MTRMSRIGLGAAAIALMAIAGGTPADARCSRVSASGLGLGPEIAKEMAKMNLDTSIAAKGMKARGRTHYRCTGPFMSECTATRRAC